MHQRIRRKLAGKCSRAASICDRWSTAVLPLKGGRLTAFQSTAEKNLSWSNGSCVFLNSSCTEFWEFPPRPHCLLHGNWRSHKRVRNIFSLAHSNKIFSFQKSVWSWVISSQSCPNTGGWGESVSISFWPNKTNLFLVAQILTHWSVMTTKILWYLTTLERQVSEYQRLYYVPKVRFISNIFPFYLGIQ